jgi:hypothetical protein
MPIYRRKLRILRIPRRNPLRGPAGTFPREILQILRNLLTPRKALAKLRKGDFNEIERKRALIRFAPRNAVGLRFTAQTFSALG